MVQKASEDYLCYNRFKTNKFFAEDNMSARDKKLKDNEKFATEVAKTMEEQGKFTKDVSPKGGAESGIEESGTHFHKRREKTYIEEISKLLFNLQKGKDNKTVEAEIRAYLKK